MIRGDYIVEIRNAGDAESDIRFPTPRIVTVLDLVWRREWRNILNAQPRYRFATRSPVTDSNGQFPISALSGGSGDALQNFYRVIDLTVGDRIYQQVDFREAPLLLQVPGQPYAYYAWMRIGDMIQIAPADPLTTVVAYVNWMPTKPSLLSADSVPVDFPDGYELILAYEAAGMLMAKGGLEPDAMQVLKGLAEEMRKDMLADLVRISNDPTQMKYSDSRGDWAG